MNFLPKQQNLNKQIQNDLIPFIQKINCNYMDEIYIKHKHTFGKCDTSLIFCIDGLSFFNTLLVICINECCIHGAILCNVSLSSINFLLDNSSDNKIDLNTFKYPLSFIPINTVMYDL